MNLRSRYTWLYLKRKLFVFSSHLNVDCRYNFKWFYCCWSVYIYFQHNSHLGSTGWDPEEHRVIFPIPQLAKIWKKRATYKSFDINNYKMPPASWSGPLTISALCGSKGMIFRLWARNRNALFSTIPSHMIWPVFCSRSLCQLFYGLTD